MLSQEEKRERQKIQKFQKKNMEIYLKNYNMLFHNELLLNIISYISVRRKELHKGNTIIKRVLCILNLGLGGVGKSRNAKDFFIDFLDLEYVKVVTRPSPESLETHTFFECKNGWLIIIPEADEIIMKDAENMILTLKLFGDGYVSIDTKQARKNNDGNAIEYSFNASMICNINKIRKDANIEAVYDRYLFTYYDTDVKNIIDCMKNSDDLIYKQELKDAINTACEEIVEFSEEEHEILLNLTEEIYLPFNPAPFGFTITTYF